VLLNNGTRLHFTHVTKNPLIKRSRYNKDAPVSRIANKPDNILEYINYKKCIGSVSNEMGSNVLHGKNTKFRSDLENGDTILIGNFIRIIENIESNNILTLTNTIDKENTHVEILKKDIYDWWLIECEMLLENNKNNSIKYQQFQDIILKEFNVNNSRRKPKSSLKKANSLNISRKKNTNIRRTHSNGDIYKSKKKYIGFNKLKSAKKSNRGNITRKKPGIILKKNNNNRQTSYSGNVESINTSELYTITDRVRYTWKDVKGNSRNSKLLVVIDTPLFYNRYYNIIENKNNSGFEKMQGFITPNNTKYICDAYTIIKHEFYHFSEFNLKHIPYYLVIFNDPDLHSIRDLNSSHIYLLSDVLDIFNSEIRNIEHNDLDFSFYFHYYPSYFRLHMHIRLSGDCKGCTNTENRAYLLDNPEFDSEATTIRKGYPVQYVINRIKEMDNYFQINPLYLEIENNKFKHIINMVNSG